MIKFKYLLTPVALVAAFSRNPRTGENILGRHLYVFGVRVAYWTVLSR
jgi:hypothetical protein